MREPAFRRARRRCCVSTRSGREAVERHRAVRAVVPWDTRRPENVAGCDRIPRGCRLVIESSRAQAIGRKRSCLSGKPERGGEQGRASSSPAPLAKSEGVSLIPRALRGVQERTGRRGPRSRLAGLPRRPRRRPRRAGGDRLLPSVCVTGVRETGRLASCRRPKRR